MASLKNRFDRSGKAKDIPLNRIPKSKLDVVVKGNHQGVFARSAIIKYADMEVLVRILLHKGQSPVLLLLDGIQDVRNMGAIARSAEVFGADAIIVPGKKSAPLNEVAIKSSAGALMHLPICRVSSLSSAIEWLCRNDIEVYGADTGSSKPLHAMDFSGPCAIVLGCRRKRYRSQFENLF